MPTKRSLMEAAARLGVAFDVPPWLRKAETVDMHSAEWQAVAKSARWGNVTPKQLFSLAEQRDALRQGKPLKRSVWQRIRAFF